MIALFNKDTDLVGWLSDDKRNIFDIDLNWTAFVANDSSVWNVNNMSWLGHLYGSNIRDFNGKTLFWNPNTPIQNTPKPFRPFRPFKPFKPFKPFRPLKPFTPMGGWSNLVWSDFVNL